MTLIEVNRISNKKIKSSTSNGFGSKSNGFGPGQEDHRNFLRELRREHSQPRGDPAASASSSSSSML